eukprot:154858-Chlamydomonas_euryale.AAC.5
MEADHTRIMTDGGGETVGRASSGDLEASILATWRREKALEQPTSRAEVGASSECIGEEDDVVHPNLPPGSAALSLLSSRGPGPPSPAKGASGAPCSITGSQPCVFALQTCKELIHIACAGRLRRASMPYGVNAFDASEGSASSLMAGPPVSSSG